MVVQSKREIGLCGEKLLDVWMDSHGWKVEKQNIVVPGGEIDRVYSFQSSKTNQKSFCICEIKTRFVYRTKEIEQLFTETGFKRHLKHNQIKNLYRFSEMQEARGGKKNKFFIRFFLILRSGSCLEFKQDLLDTKGGIKVCLVEKDQVILSVQPEITFTNARKSMLQTYFK